MLLTNEIKRWTKSTAQRAKNDVKDIALKTYQGLRHSALQAFKKAFTKFLSVLG
jgi:hypothetical protein